MLLFGQFTLPHLPRAPAGIRPAPPPHGRAGVDHIFGGGPLGGNLTRNRHYLEQHWRQNKLDKGGFTRRLHFLTDTLLALFATCGQVLKDRHTEARYVIDSFPVAVCHNSRIPRCNLLTGSAYRGRSASKRQWFHDFKIQVITTGDGARVEFYVHAGSEADITGLRALPVDLPAGSVLYGDNAYTD